MAQWLQTAQRLPLWVHAVYLAALAVAAFIIAFHDLTPNGWPVILCLLAAGALAMGAWCGYEHVTRNREKGEEEGSDAFSEMPASLVVLPIFDVTLTGLTLTFSSAVDSVGWVIVLIILLLVMLALGLIISLIAFRTKQAAASPSRANVKVVSGGCDELSAWSIPVVYSLTAFIELLVIFCLALDVVPLGAMLVACLLQLAVLVCTALSVVWILLYRKHHNSLPILRNFEDFIFTRVKSTKGADKKTGPTNIYYLPIGPINTKASEFENALRRFVAAKGGVFSLQQLPSNASSDVISGRSVILVPCFQDGGAIHLASDVRSVMEVAGTMLAAHSPGMTKIWLVIFHRHSPELGDIETTVETLPGTFFEQFQKAYKAFFVFDVVYGQNGSFFANTTNTDSFDLMTSLIIQPNDI